MITQSSANPQWKPLAAQPEYKAYDFIKRSRGRGGKPDRACMSFQKGSSMEIFHRVGKRFDIKEKQLKLTYHVKLESGRKVSYDLVHLKDEHEMRLSLEMFYHHVLG